MPKIDKKMQKMMQDYTHGAGGTRRQVTRDESISIVKRAHKLNNSGTSSYKKETNNGMFSLRSLLNTYETNVSPEAKKIFEDFLSVGKLPKNSPPTPTGELTDRRPSISTGPHTGATNLFNRLLTIDGDSSESVVSEHSSRTTSMVETPLGGISPVIRRLPSGSILVGQPSESPLAPSSLSERAPRRINRRSERHSRRHLGNNPTMDNSVNPTIPYSIGGATGSSVRIARPRLATPPMTTSTPRVGTTVEEVPTVAFSPNIQPETLDPAPAPGTDTRGAIPEATPPVDTSAPTVVTNPTVGTDGPYGKIIIKWQSAKKTWGCHWFPQKETKPGGDPINNLYAPGGALDKHDKVTGRKAREYEFEHNRKAENTGSTYAWWGHCNNSCECASVFQSPKHPVTVTGQDSQPVTYSINDIAGLLVKVVPGLVKRVDFKGNRFNSEMHDNVNDPSPEVFLDGLEEWTKDDMPISLDIDPKAQVWNFPYDQVEVSESTNAPSDFAAADLPDDGSVKYYHVEMSGTGFPDKKRTYEFYIQRNEAGVVVASSWIKTPGTHQNPDFMWRSHPIGDLMNKANWKLAANPSNPHVDPQFVYDLYMQSLA